MDKKLKETVLNNNKWILTQIMSDLAFYIADDLGINIPEAEIIIKSTGFYKVLSKQCSLESEYNITSLRQILRKELIKNGKYDVCANSNITDFSHFAHTMLHELVYNSAVIAGCSLSLSQVSLLLENIPNYHIDEIDIRVVKNLRDAYLFVLDPAVLGRHLDLPLLKEINFRIVRNENIGFGSVRSYKRFIAGTNYEISELASPLVDIDLTNMNSIEDSIELALHLFCYAVGHQVFCAANIRTATIAANWALIRKNTGILLLVSEHYQEFDFALKHFLKYRDSRHLKDLLIKCIIPKSSL